MLASLLVGASSPALAGTRVVFTVDVESTEAFSLPQQQNARCRDGSACGLMEIARLLAERGWAGTFFLNVYEYRAWGEAAVQGIANALQAAGQDVALHTHPQWAYDSARTGMYQYSLEAQTAIVRDGVRLLASWTGLPVVAHRAGDYAADERTLEALERNGLRVDSSLFWGNPRSKLNGLGMPRNLPSQRGSLVEIPVTVYEREERPRFLGDLLPPALSVRKIDPDWFDDEEEAGSAFDAAVAANIPLVVVFLHSSSLIAAGGDGTPPVDFRTLRNFRTILDRVAAQRLPVVTMRDLAGAPSALAPSGGRDVVPRVGVRVGVPRYLWHQQKRAGIRSAAAILLGLLAVGALVLVRRRKRAVRGGEKGPPGAFTAAGEGAPR